MPIPKTAAIFLSAAVLGLSMSTAAQAPAPAAPQPAVSSLTAPPPAVDLTSSLAQLQQAAGALSLDISRLRIEKWKADASVKKQSQSDADSITRNLTNALPTLIDQVRVNPQSLAAAVQLYRNVNALYDVLGTLTDMTGTFGPKAEYNALANDAGRLDSLRRDIGEKLEKLAASADREILRLRAEVASKPPPPPTKIIVEEEEKPPKKAVRKKPAQTKKPAENTPAANASPPQALTK